MTNDSYEIRIPAKLVPAMLGAIGIARNTAMMSAAGRDGAAEVQDAFDRMEEDLAAQIGAPGMFHAVDRYRFHDACTKMAQAKEFFWFRLSRHFSDSPRLSLVIDGVECPIGYSFQADSPDHDRIVEILEAYAHVEAVKRPDLSSWRELDPERDLPEDARVPAP